MSNFMRRLILVYILTILLSGTCCAQSNQTDSVTITTYYPAPYGVYKNMRIFPSTEPTGAAVNPGVIYYNKTKDTMYYRNQSQWIPMDGNGNVFDQIILKPTTRPSNPANATIYYDIAKAKIYYWNGTSWGDFPEQEQTTPTKSCTLKQYCYNPYAETPQVNSGYYEGSLIQGCKEYCQSQSATYKSTGCGQNEWIFTSAAACLIDSTYNFYTCTPNPSSGSYVIGHDHSNVKYCPIGKKADCYCQ